MDKVPVPVLLLFLLAVLQMGAFVKFTVTDSPWRLVGVAIAVVLMLVCAFGYKFFKAK